ncbi:MAG: type II secretion system F family protein [Candidatus Aenigmarchaeota archaeon]|nr:type II secretion system F family protein [Candidatus Aenigmarchaeota archaeon]
MPQNFVSLATSAFGWIPEKYEKELQPVKTGLERAGMKYLLKTWVSISAAIGVGAAVFSLALLAALSVTLKMELANIVMFSILLPPLFGMSAFLGMALYPYQRAMSRKRSIEANLPFALNHMAAIAASGVPTYVMFSLLTTFREYGEISAEARKIVRNVDTFGLSITSSIQQVGERTPSKNFKQLLEGIKSSIETGGDLKKFLADQAKDALFDYRIRREKYMELLSTYADFYTALLIAAPLFLVAILTVMNMIGGALAGASIESIMVLGIFVALPLVNIAFLAFVHMTQPEV